MKHPDDGRNVKETDAKFYEIWVKFDKVIATMMCCIIFSLQYIEIEENLLKPYILARCREV